jgi:hypothetical protein
MDPLESQLETLTNILKQWKTLNKNQNKLIKKTQKILKK